MSCWREKQNWYIHTCYVQQYFDECLNAIEELLAETAFCEYALYVKALIFRRRGNIQESLTLFQSATCLNPQNILNLKQVGHSLFLLGKHKQAIEVYDEARKIGIENERAREGKGMSSGEDWEIWHNKGLCYMYLKQFDFAVDCFMRANALQRHDATFIQLGKVYQLQENFKEALRVYEDALDFSPDSAELLSTLGLLYLRMGDNARAFEKLGNALSHNPRMTKAILAAGSIIQDNQDMDTALVKYRVAAVHAPNSAQLWNNVGMCFFGKGQFVAAVSCLRRALFLDPFEWIVCYNLGLVHISTGQYASAFHYLSASINFKGDFHASYMYLGIALARLQDFENARRAYEKAASCGEDHMVHLNYAIMLFNNGLTDEARKQLGVFQSLIGKLDKQELEHEWEVISQSQALQEALGDI